MQDVTNCGNLPKLLIPFMAAMYMNTCEKLQSMVKTQKIYGKSAAKVFMKNHKEQSSETKCTSVESTFYIRYSPSKITLLESIEKSRISMKKCKFSMLTAVLYFVTARKLEKNQRFPTKIQQKTITKIEYYFFIILKGYWIQHIHHMPRQKPRIDKHGKSKPIQLCIGLNDTCTNEVKDFKLKLCRGCKNNTNRTIHNRYNIGDEYEANGKTYKKTNTQPKMICSTKDCNNYREIADKCRGCTNGTRRTPNKDLKKGDYIELNNILYVYNGIQKVQVCTHIFENNTRCMQVCTKDKKCKKHSEHWRCKFTGAICDNIRVKRGDYCHGHKDNKINPRIHSNGENIISEYLDNQIIKYKTNKYMKTKNGYCYLDIYIPHLNIAIEYDGEQHFVQNEYWGGEEGLLRRQNADAEKDKYCFRNNIKLLRIASYDAKNKDDIIKYIDKFLNMEKHPADILYGTPYYLNIHRLYIIV